MWSRLFTNGQRNGTVTVWPHDQRERANQFDLYKTRVPALSSDTGPGRPETYPQALYNWGFTKFTRFETVTSSH